VPVRWSVAHWVRLLPSIALLLDRLVVVRVSCARGMLDFEMSPRLILSRPRRYRGLGVLAAILCGCSSPSKCRVDPCVAVGPVADAGGSTLPDAATVPPPELLPESARDLSEGDESALPTPTPSAAFIDIERVSYRDRVGERESEPARLFYSFIPARADAKEKPLFVFFNGGPGAGTTGLLHAFGTGPTTLSIDTQPPQLVDNPDGFDQLGNLLYIDGRTSGFSYAVADDPEDAAQRAEGMSPASLNEWVDAADFIRVVLRTLAREPALRNNRVVLVGESYGAIRAAMMTALLLTPQHLRGNAAPDPLVSYVDEALAAELEQHYAAVFPGVPFAEIDASVASQQFGSQVLIQPAFGLVSANTPEPSPTDCSPDSLMSRAAAAHGKACPLTSGEYDPFHWGKPEGWYAPIARAGASSMLEAAGFERRFHTPLSSVSGLRAGERAGAFRFADVARAEGVESIEPESWLLEQGPLPAWDRYYVPQFPESFSPLVNSIYIRGFFMFLQQLPWVKTLMTDARFDTFDSRAVLGVISEYHARGVDVTAQYDATPNADEPRPGWVQVDYGPSFDLPEQRRRVRLRMPAYERAAHVVTMTDGPALAQDVRAFFFPASGG
jgi:hypothetical protein